MSPSPTITTSSEHRGLRACPLAWVGVVTMAAALLVASVLTTAAGAQLPAPSPTVDEGAPGAGGNAGLVVFAVVVALIAGTTLVLVVRHRGGQRR